MRFPLVMKGSDTWTEAIRAGDFTRAWALSAATLVARDPAKRDDPALPYHLRWVWDGRPFEGREVLVRCYHGLGDTIQYARHLPALAARTASLTVEVQPSLLPLLSPLVPTATLHAFDTARPLPPAECDIEITELPFALRIDRPEGAPYLNAAPAPLPPGTIGICAIGGDWDPARSLSPELLAPLVDRGPLLTLETGPSVLAVINPAGCPMDMVETAALVAGCARIVTVDTMIAHLAGALGRPTHLLLKADPDWRWTPGAATSPWYGSMHLHHQPSPGDWHGAVADLLATIPPS